MSVFTTPVGTTETAGATSDIFTRNALACAGTGALVGVGAGSVLVVAAAAPLQVFGATIAASGAIYAGNRMADGKSINPFKKDDKSAPAVAEKPAVATEPAVAAA